MPNKIKNRIKKELKNYLKYLDNSYSLSKVSPTLFANIRNFILRKGKRVRPTLFIIGYLGFAKKQAANLYKCALSIELLHDFMLVHDDIIDKSDTRRGEPSMHKLFERQLKNFKKIKFNGQDLAIVAGDVMYAMAIDTFLSIQESMQRKEKALHRFIQAAIYTGMGEFIELLAGCKSIDKITKEDIYRIYDFKTAYYTFASPLSAGAILAGASKKEENLLYKYGIYLGRAFQIKDDILGIFADEKQIGKSPITDLQEAKKTILIWCAYKNCTQRERAMIKKVFSKTKLTKADLAKMRKIIKTSGSLDYALREISQFLKKAEQLLKSSHMHPKYKAFLSDYSAEILG